jgi:uncharacterized RDD family membrane protein YckC
MNASRELRAASFGRRILSMLYESLVVFALVFFSGLAFYAVTNGRLAGEIRHAFQLYLFLILGIYFIVCWTRGGRTLSMQTWKIRVVRGNGLPLGAGRALIRYALAWPSLALFGCGLLWALFDRDRQFLHDRLAGTKIVMNDGAGHP